MKTATPRELLIREMHGPRLRVEMGRNYTDAADGVMHQVLYVTNTALRAGDRIYAMCAAYSDNGPVFFGEGFSEIDGQKVGNGDRKFIDAQVDVEGQLVEHIDCEAELQ